MANSDEYRPLLVTNGHVKSAKKSMDEDLGLLGTLVPCVLYGSNIERLGSEPGRFANHCLPYSALYLLGNSLFGWNCLAPWFSYSSRTQIRQRFNLEGSFEAFKRSCGCCESLIEDEDQLEQCESSCDLATNLFCHACSLCQEGRELRRRMPHPGFNGRQVLVMIPPVEQTMGGMDYEFFSRSSPESRGV
ncbi:cell number regulator 8-like isoform X2 [Papaver somniferum]|nr:cell number regulator 8-like isoform X2 [Papaver somniferum]